MHNNVMWAYAYTWTQIDRLIDRQMDRQIDRWTDIEINRLKINKYVGIIM